jgi:hypothetical protein
MSPTAEPVDFIEELRLRRWARENYCYAEARLCSWHPIVHEEMQLKDADGLAPSDVRQLVEVEADTTDATGLSGAAEDAADTPAAETVTYQLARVISPIVPLAPSLPGLHGPHEITPPHTRVSEPAEKSELHIG